MGSFSWAHWLVVIVVAMIFFGGRGKISEMMGDFAKGIKAFKKGLSEDEVAEAPKDAQKLEDKAASAPPAAAADTTRKAG